MQVGLVMPVGQAEELDQIGVPEHLRRRRVGLSHHRCDFWRVQHGALEQGRLELALQLPFAPALLHRHAQVELTFLGPLALAQDDEVVGPGQLSHQR